MPNVNFTSALKRFYPNLEKQKVEAASVSELVAALDLKYPGLKGYLVDEQGRLRKHVNIYIGDNLVEDREGLQDTLKANDEILIFQALSGG